MDDEATAVGTRIVLMAALAWSVLLVLLSFVLPAVTLHSDHVGVQPRVSLATYYGLAGLWPAAMLMLAVIAASALLNWGRTAHVARWRLASLAALVVVVFLACGAAAALTHLIGLWTFPLGALLCVALALAESRRTAADAPDGTKAPAASMHAR